MPSRTLISLVSLVPFLLLAPPLAGQQPDPAVEEAPADTVFDSIQVQVVNLEVFVTDGKGDPVTGLTREDFELFVDGRPVPISNFYAASSSPRERAPEDRAPRGSAGEPSPPEAVAEEAPAPAEELNLVFYIDNFNLRPADRNRVLTALDGFVRSEVPPGARMMLVTYDHSLHVRQDLTTDAREILDAAQEVRGLSGLAPGTELRLRRAIDEIEKADRESEAMLAAESFADERQIELRRPLEALAQLMEPLGGLPGRKALVHVSNGLPNRIGEELFFLVDTRFPRSGANLRSYLFAMTSSYQRVVNAANAAGVTFYTLDAGGLTSFDSLSAAEPGSVFGGSFAIADSIRRSNLQVPLVKLAEDTGGVAVINSNDTARFLERLAADASSFYSLGYQAASDSDGRYRTIRVEVHRPGVRVRHRHGIRVRSVETRLREGVLSALTFGSSGRPFPGPVSLGRPAPQDGGVFRVPLSVRIPLKDITLVQGDREWVGRLRLAVQARDAEGDLSPATIGEPLDVRIPIEEIETARGQHITWTVELLMRGGTHELAVGLADLVADEIELTLGRVDVGSS